jgi:hypothetical protein
MPLFWRGHKFNLFAVGMKIHTIYYQFRIQLDDLVFGFMDISESGKTPNIRVQIGSELLWRVGAIEPILGDIRALLLDFGYRLYDLDDHDNWLLSRLDVCCDILGVPVSEFQYRVCALGAFVCRARGSLDAYFDLAGGRVGTGFSMGKSIRVRVYDKLLELGSDNSKLLTMKTLWGDNQAYVTRVEFQLRSKALSELSSRDPWSLNLQALWGYLTTRWFRILTGPPSNGNVPATWDLWSKISEDFPIMTRKATVSHGSDMGPLISQFVGVGATIAYRMRCEPTKESLSFFLHGLIEMHIQDVYDRVQGKISQE